MEQFASAGTKPLIEEPLIRIPRTNILFKQTLSLLLILLSVFSHVLNAQQSIEFSAWIGSEDTEITFGPEANNYDFYRSNTQACDPLDYTICENVQLDRLDGSTIFDSVLNLNQPAYYFLANEGGKIEELLVTSDYSPTPSAHQSVIFNEQLWLIGAADKNDVWSSNDGLHWTEHTDDPGFANRTDFEFIAFKDALWVIGGLSEGFATNDIWKSTDGETWEEVTSNAAFSARYGHSLIQFNDKLWLIGGFDNVYYNDVWSSDDGEHWEQVNVQAPFAPRSEHSLFVFNEKIWVTAGFNDDYLNDIWSSSDGIEWTQESNAAAFAARNKSTIRFHDDALWLIGGSDLFGSLNDIWSSLDGINWVLETEEAEFSADMGDQLESFQDQLWLFGGFIHETQRDVWRSDDGVEWRQGYTGTLIAPNQDSATNTPPTIDITSPVDGNVYSEDHSIFFNLFRFNTFDSEDDEPPSDVVWASNIDGIVSFFDDLSVGQHILTATVTDSGGLTGSNSIRIEVTPHIPSPPKITLSTISGELVFNEDDNPILFEIGLYQSLTHYILADSLVISSNLDGVLSYPAILSVGQHVITATVEASNGLTGSDSITIEITPHVNTPPEAIISAPIDGAIYTEGEPIPTALGHLVVEANITETVLSSSIDGVISSLNNLSIGQHIITYTVTDSNGISGSDSVSIEIIAEPINTPPTIEISISYHSTYGILATAYTTDAEDDNIYDSIVWVSDIDGIFENHNDLSVGNHVITATVTDSGGLTASDTISLVVHPPLPPTIIFGFPLNNASFDEDENPIGFSFFTPGVNYVILRDTLTLSSNLDGVISNPATLSVGQHIITASVNTSNGLTATATINLEITPHINTPTTIDLGNDLVINEDDFVNTGFDYAVSDAEDAYLSASNIVFSSNIDGIINSYRDLSIGQHIVTAIITDSGGLTGTDSINIEVTAHIPVAPQLGIFSPLNNAVINEQDNPVEFFIFHVAVTNQKDASLMDTLTLSSSLDGVITNPATLSVGQHVITASITSVNGLTGSTSVNIEVLPKPNASPVININSPLSGSIFTDTENPIVFDIQANDEEDGDISENIELSSSLDGTIGKIASLSLGVHTITASISDSEGATTEATMHIEIIENNRDELSSFDFTNELPGTSEGWEYYSSNKRHPQISLIDGTLSMGAGSRSRNTLNEAIYELDLNGAINTSLSFTLLSDGTAFTDLPDVFNGHVNGSGVALSVDGNTWYKALPASLLDEQSEAQRITINLEQLQQNIRKNFDAEFMLNDTTFIKFQQFGHRKHSNNAIRWDDIQIQANYSNLAVSLNTPIDIVLLESELGTQGCETYTIENTSGSNLPWQVQSRASWLTLDYKVGELEPNTTNNIQACWDTADFTVNNHKSALIYFYDPISAVMQSREINLRILPDNAKPPFHENFSAGLPLTHNGVWQFYSSKPEQGFIDVIDQRLHMGANSRKSDNLNEAILKIDLSHVSQAELSFFHLGKPDKQRSMPNVYPDHYKANGVSISNDGLTWYKIMGSKELRSDKDGKHHVIDLNEHIERIRENFDSEFSYTEDFYIKFQQYANRKSDKAVSQWDDISVIAQ